LFDVLRLRFHRFAAELFSDRQLEHKVKSASSRALDVSPLTFHRVRIELPKIEDDEHGKHEDSLLTTSGDEQGSSADETEESKKRQLLADSQRSVFSASASPQEMIHTTPFVESFRSKPLLFSGSYCSVLDY